MNRGFFLMKRFGRMLNEAPQALTLLALGNLLALALALIAQYGYDMLPCAWCIVQRMDVLLLLWVTLLGALLARVAPRAAPIGAAALGAALAAGGLVAAWHQHTVASKQLSCAFTWADRTLMTLGLDAWWPALFQVQATCADAAQARVLGWPFELWSSAWFALCLAGCLWVLILASRPRSRLGARPGLPVH